MAGEPTIGRDRELELLSEAVESTIDGRGSVWFLTGEPGIGKSFLAGETALLARHRGMRAFWGRCWEAGGAPAYWPWIQVLRGVLRTSEPDRIASEHPVLAQLLPELRGRRPKSEAMSLGPEQARFRLMDAVSRTLSAAAGGMPTLVVLEDLHAADVSSILLLEFLAPSSRNQPLMILGTFREAELALTSVGSQLVRASQQGRRLSLERFDEEDVARFLQQSGEYPEPALVHALHRATDGNPLFLVELARLWKAQGSSAAKRPLSIPPSIRTAIQARLATITPMCMQTLRCGAVVGREFDVGLLAACYDADPDELVRNAQEATNAAILIETAPQRYRFVHFLIREQVYDAIIEADRADAHARVAEALHAEASDGDPPWPEIAHHLAAAGRRADAARALREAGQQALDQLAFEEAVHAYDEALRTAERSGDVAKSDRIELLLSLGHAQTRAGDIEEGKRTCARAAELAKDIDDAQLLARAALEHGAALLYGKVDSELILLLQDALDALGQEDGALRARVMARLAAARQPADDPEAPMQLARDAIAMARRIRNPATLLDTLRNGGSAMVDLGDVQERLALDREHAALADELQEPVEALRGNLRAIMDYLALERLDDAFRAMRTCDRIAERLGHPTYVWPSIALQALRALWEGRLDEAEPLIDQVSALGTAGADPNAEVVYLVQRLRLLRLRGDYEAQLPLLDRLARCWDSAVMGRMVASLTVGVEHAWAGRAAAARRHFDGDAMRRLLRLGDHTLQLCIAKLCMVADDRELAELVHRRLLVTRDQLVTGGVMYMTVDGPTSWGLASTATFLGKDEEAREHFEHALDVCRRTRGRPVQALISFEYASYLLRCGDQDSVARARELLGLAARLAEQIGMGALSADVARTTDTLSPSAPNTSHPDFDDLSITRAGDSWLVSCGNVEFHLKDLRGVRLLARLVSEPGREFHVLDLSGSQNRSARAPDRGDGGELLDEEARRQYRERIEALRGEVTEAEQWNDAGRATRAREELGFIEQELARAVGLGGRARRSSSAAERARVNVQRRIRDAIQRIETYHPGLARHLDRAIRTGAYCAYEP